MLVDIIESRKAFSIFTKLLPRLVSFMEKRSFLLKCISEPGLSSFYSTLNLYLHFYQRVSVLLLK